MSEQLKILEMIEKGQISAAEGMELLEALKTQAEPEAKVGEALASTTPRNYKFLRVKVTSDNQTVNVNVNIPIRLLTTIGEIATKVTAYIPAEARAQMEAKGVNISEIDFGQIIQDLLSGTLDDPDIVNVEAWDEEHKTMIQVRIYVD
jgi:uncharacterized alkaline shock family protein YloU